MKSMILPEHVLKLVSAKDRAELGKAGLLASEANEKGVARAERELQGEIVQYLNLQGIAVLWHRTDKRSHATIGWPDLTFCKDGVPWGIEVKTSEGRVRPEQYETMRKMGLNGWQVGIARSFQEFHDMVFRGYE
jgi:hypothetical protein